MDLPSLDRLRLFVTLFVPLFVMCLVLACPPLCCLWEPLSLPLCPLLLVCPISCCRVHACPPRLCVA